MNPFLAKIYETLGDCFSKIDPTSAIQFFKKSFPIWAEIEGYDSESIASVFEKMGREYVILKLYKDSLVYFARANIAYEFNFGKMDMRVANIHFLCGKSFELLERYPEAIREYKKSLSIYNTFYSKENETVKNISNTIADLCEKIGNIEDAHFFRIRGHEYKELEDPDDFSILIENLGL